MNARLIILAICVAISLDLMAQNVVLNEIMASNQQTIADEDGDYPDWIELYNSGSEIVDLSGWYLSDDESDPTKWQIGEAAIEPQGFLLIFASDKDRDSQLPLHTNFKISSSGEPILLSNSEGQLLSLFPATPLGEDLSLGSSEDGAISDLVFFIQSSPGYSNALGETTLVAWDEVSFSEPAGFYDASLSLAMSSAFPLSEIRYTTDGSEPTMDSDLYTEEIVVQDRFNEPDGISTIRTALEWEAPKTPGEKATVFKAASFYNGKKVSAVTTSSYFISSRLDKKYEGLPVISLSADADSLFDYHRGIYVPGVDYSGPVEFGTENFNRKGEDWEREMTFEYFDTDHNLEFIQQVGARIHGRGSRYHSQKSLRIYARGSYGEPYLDYEFFDGKNIDQFKRIILRNSSTDVEGTMFKDILCSELVSDMDVDYQESQVAIVFINGEYWGVHGIRERIDKHYMASNHTVSPDSLDMLVINAEVEEGDNQAYLSLLDYVATHDITESEHFEFVKNKLDLDNLMDYYISQLYFSNIDWPELNIRFWRPRQEEGKWRWIFYDCDYCMLLNDYNHLENFVQENDQFNSSPEWTILLFNRLLKNQEFKGDFIQRFFYHLSTTFTGDRVLAKIDSLERIYQPLVLEHMNRWNYPSSIFSWNESLQELKGFAIKRPAVMVQQLMEHIGEQYSLYPNPVDRSKSFVSLDMEYWEGVDVTIQVFSPQGRLIHGMELDQVDEEAHPQIPIGNLSPGLYIMRIQYGALVFSEKLVVK